MRLGALLALIAAGLAGDVLEASAQTVMFERGRRGLPLADEAVERVLARGQYRVLTRDTILGAGEVIAGDVVVLQATLRIEGRIEGDLIAVRSDVFARPGGQIDGAVVVLGGGFYGSSLAKLGSSPVDASRYSYQVGEREAGAYVVRAPGGKVGVKLPGFYGLGFPTYDRVNGLTLTWNVELRGGQPGWLPEASGRIGYRSERTDVDGGLELRWPFGRHAVSVRGGLTVRSNDRWINGDMENSLYSLTGGVDTRNYYEARFAEAALHLGHGTRLRWSHDLAVGWERARSLEDRDPFSIFSVRGGFQRNPAVREADIVGLALVSAVRTSDRRRVSLDFSLSLEVAERDVAGDLSFTVLAATARGVVGTVGDQSLILQGFGQIPGSAGAPPQRWRALGGWGTLPTLVPGERWGDSSWWLAATYRVPLPWGLGVLGRVVPWMEYAAGNAWVDDDERPTAVHNLGLGVSLGRLGAALFADPGDDFETFLALGFAPRRWPANGQF
jgi:hypothetical protein